MQAFLSFPTNTLSSHVSVFFNFSFKLTYINYSTRNSGIHTLENKETFKALYVHFWTEKPAFFCSVRLGGANEYCNKSYTVYTEMQPIQFYQIQPIQF